ncbi:hypothetical protein F4780DRAFT_696734 [Xylariomycetidae sp. FL0641]|nr:hypothetical protein F4780DRAFT_696734 [Xylariomycetidae sp. FL0641]
MSYQLRPTQQHQEQPGIDQPPDEHELQDPHKYQQNLFYQDHTRNQEQQQQQHQPTYVVAPGTAYYASPPEQQQREQPQTWVGPPYAKTLAGGWASSTTATTRGEEFGRQTPGANSASRLGSGGGAGGSKGGLGGGVWASDDGRRICGITRSMFFVVLAVGVFFVVVAVAVGVGVGLGTGSTPTTPSNETATGNSSLPTYTGTPGDLACPSSNNTVYVSSYSSPFDIQCGRDYSSSGGARDLEHMTMATLAECIDACGARDDCVGVGYGSYQNSPTCWMKSQLGDPNWSYDWSFARLQSYDD